MSLPMTKSAINPDDAVILFADLQAGIIELTKTTELVTLRHHVSCLSKLAKLFSIPCFVTGVQGEDGSPAKVTPEIAAELGELPVHYRVTCDALRNEAIVSAIKATGRKTLLISGVATELAVQLAALSAVDHGFKSVVVLDACGGVGERTERAALQRITQAGAVTTSVMTLAGEMAGELTTPKAFQAVGVVFEMAQG